ncbi:MAG: hypothetical protein ACHP7O_06260 [Burkholderiales bacterium]
MVLHQIQAAYRAEEDRLLLRVSFSADDGPRQEIRAWLTRRLVKALWPAIIHAMETQVALDHPHAAHARVEIVNMEHEATISEIRAHGKFGMPFAPESYSFPFGEQPVLLTGAHISVKANQTPRINFVSALNGNFEITLTSSMLHGLCTLLQDAIKPADWNIELHLPGIPAEQRPEQRVLN